MTARSEEAAGEALWSVAAAVDTALRAFVDRQAVGEFYDLVRYHLGWAGGGAGPLRSRAVLCVLACQACGGAFEDALPMAVAIALLHSFKINQEDMEQHRRIHRGRESVWSVWGTPQAMNAGDGMHALAKMALLEGRGRLPAAMIVHLEQELDESCLRCCEAIYEEQVTTDPAQRLALAAAKGADLFGRSAGAGCCVAGSGEPEVAAGIKRFGEQLGAALGVKLLDRRATKSYVASALATLAGTPLAPGHAATLRGLADHVLDRSD